MCRFPCRVLFALALALVSALSLPAQQGTKEETPAPAQRRTDLFGEPLPPGAVARLGSIRFRQPNVPLDLAFSPDGNTLAVATPGTGTHTLRLLDATTGQEVRRLSPPQYNVYRLDFSADGKWIVGTSGLDVHFWDAQTGKKLRDLRGHEGGIGALALSRDGKTLAVSGGLYQGGRRHTIRLLDAVTGKQLHALVGHEVCAHWLGFSADGRRLASSSRPLHYADGASGVRVIPGLISLWDVSSGKALRRLETLSHETVLSPDHKTLASRRDWHADGITLLQAVESGKEIARCEGDRYDGFLFSPDGKTLVTGGHSGWLRLWDAATGKEIRRLGNSDGTPVSLKAFSPDGKRLACVGNNSPDDSLIRIWNVATGEEVQAAGGHRARLTCVAVSPDGLAVVSGSADRTLRLWQACTGKELRRFEGHRAAVNAVCFAPDGKVVASGAEDATVRLWDAASGRERRRLAGHAAPIVSVAFRGDRLLTADRQGGLKLWEIATGKASQPFGQAWTSLSHADLSPEGKYFVRCGRNAFGEPALEVARADRGKPLWTIRHDLPAEQKEMAGVSLVYLTAVFSPSERLLASSECTIRERSGSHIRPVIRLWEVVTGKEVLKIEGGHFATALAFSPDGKTLVSTHGNERHPAAYPASEPFANATVPEDATIRFWDVATGKEVGSLPGHLCWTSGVAFFPDGRKLVSAGADRTALVWALR